MPSRSTTENEPGMMVAFRIEPDGTILFVAFTDLWNR
jgi:hypothetical protein